MNWFGLDCNLVNVTFRKFIKIKLEIYQLNCEYLYVSFISCIKIFIIDWSFFNFFCLSLVLCHYGIENIFGCGFFYLVCVFYFLSFQFIYRLCFSFFWLISDSPKKNKIQLNCFDRQFCEILWVVRSISYFFIAACRRWYIVDS